MNFSFDPQLTRCVLNELTENKTKLITKILRCSDIKYYTIKDGRIDVEDYFKSRVYSISVIELVDSIVKYKLNEKIDVPVFNFLNSLKIELQNRNKIDNIFSELFDELSGVNKTRNYELREILKDELAKRLEVADREINILASLWGNGNFYELARDLKGEVVPDLEKFLINSGLSKKIVDNLIKFKSISPGMKPLKIWLMIQLLFLWNPKDFREDRSFFDSLIISIDQLEDDKIAQIINYILKNKAIRQGDFEGKIEYCLHLVKLDIPWSSLKNLSFEEIKKIAKFGAANKTLHLGYSLKNTDHIDYKDVLNKSNTWQEFFFLCSTSSDEETFVKKHSEFGPSETIAKHYLINKEQWGEKMYKADQIAYGNHLHQSVLVGAAALNENRWNFTQLLNFLGYQRYKIAEESKAKNALDFGILHCLQSIGMKSDYFPGSVYEELGHRLHEHIKKWEEENDQNYNPSTGYIEIEIKGEKIQLSRFSDTKVEHPFFNEVRKVLDYVEELYNECLLETDHEELLQKLGQIFWLICQAKPWLRGDPSIAEMLIKAVWLHKTGELLPPWKKGLIPWESVIEKTHFKTYGEEFYQLFETSPL